MSGVTHVTSNPASVTWRWIWLTLPSFTCHMPTNSTPVRPGTFVAAAMSWSVVSLSP